MSAAVHFKQADVTRAVKGFVAAGQRVGTVRIDPRGFIEIVAEQSAPKPRGTSWDDVLP